MEIVKVLSRFRAKVAKLTIASLLSTLFVAGAGVGIGVLSATSANAVTVTGPVITAITSTSSSSILVTFTPPTPLNGCTITGYEYTTNGSRYVTRDDGGGTTSPMLITKSSTGNAKLSRGSVTISIQATLSGSGCTRSDPSTSATVIVGTATAPTITNVVSLNSQSLSISFTPPSSDGGAAISSYKYSTDGTTWKSRTDGGTIASPITITQTSPTGTTSLTNGTSYSIRILAVNSSGDGAASTIYYGTPSGPPAAPSSISAIPGNSLVNLLWGIPSTNGGSPITGYRIDISSDGGSTWTTNIANTGNTSLSSTIQPLSNGVTYKFRVYALNAKGTSATYVESAAIPAGAPSAPTITSITPASQSLSVVFTVPSSNGGSDITGYKYSTDGGISWVTRTDGGTIGSPLVITKISSNTSLTLANLTTYSVSILAINSAGDGAAATYVSATPDSGLRAPSAPTINAITASNVSLSVDFSAGSNGGATITNYQYSTDNGSTWDTRTAGTTGSPIIISRQSSSNIPLVNGNTYQIKIKALNSVGYGTASTATAAIPATVPNAPTGVSGVPSGSSVALSWTTPASNGGNAITGYKVEYSSNSGSTYSSFTDNTFLTSTVLTVTGLTNGTSYLFRVSAINDMGMSTASSPSSAVTPVSAPDAPTITTITPTSQTLSVAFTAPASNGGLAVTSYDYSTDDGVTWNAASGTTSPISISFQSADGTTSLVNNTTYAVKLRANNSIGPGQSSNTVSSTPSATLKVPETPTITSITPGNLTLSVAFNPPSSNGGATITSYQYSTNDGVTWDTRTAGTDGSPLIITRQSNLSALVNGTPYTVKIRARNSVGYGAISTAVIATPASVPTAPTLNSVTAGNAQLSLAFSAPSSDGGSAITSYQYSTDGTNWKTRTDNPSSLLSPMVITQTSLTGTTALANGTTYSVRVRAVNAAGDSDSSTAISGTPLTTPGAPTIDSSTVSNQLVTIYFTTPISTGGSSITNYEFSTDGGLTWVARATPSTTSPLVITRQSSSDIPVVDGTAYTIKIRAVNNQGSGDASFPTSATPKSVPDAPTSVTTTRGNSQLTVSWTASAPRGATVTAYTVTANDATKTCTTTGATSCTVTGLTNGTLYTFRVYGTNSVGNSALSETSTAMAPGTVPTSPGTVTGTSGNAQVSLSWSTPTSDGDLAISDYEIQYSSNSGSSWMTFSHSVSVSTSIDVTGLVNGTNYLFRVAAKNVAGTGTYSTIASAVIPATVPDAPPAVASLDGNETATITWEVPASNGSSISYYKIEKSENNLDWSVVTSTATGTAYAVTGLTNGTSYYFRVSAINGKGVGNPRSASSYIIPSTVPSAPSAPTPTPLSDTVTVTWSAPNNNGNAIISYEVQYSVTGANTWVTANSAVGGTSLIVTGLTPNQAYDFRITARNGKGQGPRGSIATATTSKRIQTVSITAGATELNYGGELAFTASTDAGSVAWTYTTSTPSICEIVGNSIRAKAIGSCVVTAQGGANDLYAIGSGDKTFTVKGITPGAPTSVVVSTVDTDTARVTWSDPGSNGGLTVETYTVTATGGGSSIICEVAATSARTCDIDGLLPATVYSISIAATNSAGIGPGSAGSSYTPGKSGQTVTVDRSALTSKRYSNGTISLAGKISRSSASSHSLSVSPSSVCSISPSDSNTIVINSAGDCTVTASVLEDDTYNAASDEYTFTIDSDNPDDVTSPTATAGNATADLTWASLTDTLDRTGGKPLSSYQVEYSSDAGANWTSYSSSVPKSASSLQVTGLNNGTNYIFRVRAKNSDNKLSPGSIVSATVKPKTTPGLPASLSTSVVGESVTVTWSAPENDGGDSITAYVVEYREVGAASWSLLSDSETETSKVHSNPSLGVDYEYQVRARNGAGSSSNRATASSTSVPKRAHTVSFTDSISTIDFNPAGTSSGTLSASNTVSELATTKRFARASGDACSVDEVTGAITTLKAGTCSVSVNANGNSNYVSASASKTITVSAIVPGAPSISSVNSDTTTVTLSWTAGHGGGANIDGYKIETATSASGPWTVMVANTGSPDTTYVASGLSTGVFYYFKISAINTKGVGNGSVSSVVALNRRNQNIILTPSTLDFGSDDVSITYSKEDSASPSITSLTPSVCSIVSNKIRPITAGNCQVRVSAAGDATFNSGDATEIFTIAAVAPDAPSLLSTTAGEEEVTVTWSAPVKNGGQGLTTYTVTSTPGGLTCTASHPATSCVITGLTPGTSYSFAVTVTNGARSSARSSTRSATPIARTPSGGGGTPAPATPATVKPEPEKSEPVKPEPVKPEPEKPAPIIDKKKILPPVILEVLPAAGNTTAKKNGDEERASLKITRKENPAVNTDAAPMLQTTAEVVGSNWTVSVVSLSSNSNLAVGTTASSTSEASGTPIQRISFENSAVATLTGTGFAPNSLVSIYLFSTPTLVGTITTDESGIFKGDITVPANLRIGEHTLQLNGLTPALEIRSVSIPIVISSKTLVTKSETFNIYFGMNSWWVNSAGHKEIRKAIKKVPKSSRPYVVIVTGFVQPTTIDPFPNLAIDRAKAVIKAMKKVGFMATYTPKRGPKMKMNLPEFRRATVTISWNVKTS